TPKRQYLIIDAPGHIEFLKNMVTGASHAEAALLVIDANEGVQENSRRHGYMISMLGIKQIVILVNKMDLVNYDQKRFEDIKKEYTAFLKEIKVKPVTFIPVSGREGDNIASNSPKMPWYTGDTVLSILDSFEKEKQPIDRPFRMPVQDVYKFTKGGDDRRIVAGTVESGRLRVGDEVVFYPSGKKSTVKSIEAFNAPKQEEVTAGYATGFTLTEQIYVSRGEIATRADEPHPEVTTRIRANVFWLGKKPLEMKKEYILKLGTARVIARVERIEKVINAAALDVKNQNFVNRHEVAEVVLKLKKAIAFELPHQSPSLSRFVLVDDYEISGGGIIVEALEDRQHWVRDIVFMRNYKWEK
ncbi:MAG: adenylyl-sulfate kinase, partial [Methanobacteriota archaeon]